MTPRMIYFIGLVSLSAILVCGPAALAGDPHDISAMRCSGKIIKIGTPKYEVRGACGVPTYEEDLGRGGELWVFDFGSSQLVYYLTFNGIKLSRIQTGQYGN